MFCIAWDLNIIFLQVISGLAYFKLALDHQLRKQTTYQEGG